MDDEPLTAPTCPTSDDDDTGVFPFGDADDEDTRPGPLPSRSSRPSVTAPSAPTPAPPPSADDPLDETQALETQAVSREELEQLRGAHLRRQKRRLALRAVLLVFLLGTVVGLYAWLSDVRVNPYLVAPKITFDGIIRDNGGQVGIVVPYHDGGRPTFSSEECVRWETALGDQWETPFLIELTNWVDSAALRESREATFARWRAAAGAALRWDPEFARPPLFLGGGGGAYPGVRCLMEKYYRVDERGDNLVGTAVFFRSGDHCWVLRRELPAEEEGRGWIWLTEIWTTLYANPRLKDGSENRFPAIHWEGSADEDDPASPAVVVDDCRSLLERGDMGAWVDVERNLSLVLRALHGRADPDSQAIRVGALDSLAALRRAQRDFWNRQCLAAVQASSLSDDALRRVQQQTADRFPSADDERHFLVHREQWWMPHPEGN